MSKQEFLELLSRSFHIQEENPLYQTKELHTFSMYLENEWFSLKVKKELINEEDPVGSLDPQILSDLILSPILGVHDLKTDNRVSFIDGKRGMKALQDAVDSNAATVAFGLYPVSIDQLKLVSDTNNIMPPKSTWIEPKLRSGLVIFEV